MVRELLLFRSKRVDERESTRGRVAHWVHRRKRVIVQSLTIEYDDLASLPPVKVRIAHRLRKGLSANN